MTDLTIFTAPKPFTNPQIALIQRNAIRSWVELGPEVDVILIGEEDGLAEAAAELRVHHLPGVKRNANGTPLVSSMFSLARQHSASPLLACVNADILLMPDILKSGRAAVRQSQHFLLVGQRYDLDVYEPLDFSPGWPERLRSMARQRGRLHRASGSDYFVFSRDSFKEMPDFAIGRAGWDNWMIYAARTRGWPVADATHDVMIVHQNHDYSHLPGGQPHYKLPETFENVRLAGGPRTIFELPDTSHRLVEGRLRKQPLSWQKFWREVEIFPLVRLHSYPLAQVTYGVFHPVKAYRDFRAYLNKKKG